MENEEDDETYTALVNDEEQYCLWPDEIAVPAGWREAGRRGSKAECLEFINRVWTDMRPLSLRRKMAEAEAEAVTA